MGRLSRCALLFAACYRPNAAVGVPCADNGACPSGQQCDPSSQTCVTQLVDAAADAAATIEAGALIIPMDDAFQAKGQMLAFGLVYQLLKGGVAVDWIVKAGKAQGDPDLVTDAALADHVTGVAIASPASYAGGPFVIEAADRAQALPIVNAWLAAQPNTVVHDVVSGSANAVVTRRLAVAPAIAVFGDTNDSVAFTYLNAAKIPDSTGATWGSASPDVLTEAAVAGPTTTDHGDGALFDANRQPRYRAFIAMHYAATTVTPEVAAELRTWLGDPHASAVLECLAAGTLENAGHYLTTAGVTINAGSAVPGPVAEDAPDDPHAQFVDDFAAGSGALQSISLPADSAFAPGVVTLLHDATTPTDLVWITGHLDGDPAHGDVSYLGGHNYPTTEPIMTNPGTNGARLFLDGLFASGATNP